MDLSPSIDYLMERAVAETAAADFDEIKIEHFCMALLKLSELSFDIPEMIKPADARGVRQRNRDAKS